MKKRNKILLIAGTCALVVGAAATLSTMWYLKNNNPEAILYQALSAEQPAGSSTVEEIVDSTTDGNVEGLIDNKGTYKMMGHLACTASDPSNGGLSLKISLQQHNADFYMRFDELALTGAADADQATISEYNQFFKDTIVNKWVLMDQKDKGALGFQEKGVAFTQLGAVSKHKNQADLTKLLVDNNVVKIVSVKEFKNGGQPLIEYNLEIRRSNYEHFMDSVEPRFPYKEDVLDELFDNSTQDITVVVNKKTKQVKSQSYRMENLCASFMTQFDESLGAQLTSTMKVEGTLKAKSSIKDLKAPTDFLTEKQYTDLLYGEE